jgi:hypothetical protein
MACAGKNGNNRANKMAKNGLRSTNVVKDATPLIFAVLRLPSSEKVARTKINRMTAANTEIAIFTPVPTITPYFAPMTIATSPYGMAGTSAISNPTSHIRISRYHTDSVSIHRIKGPRYNARTTAAKMYIPIKKLFFNNIISLNLLRFLLLKLSLLFQHRL